jgi:alpha-tubulin suppressor-like RCC1 family protein
LISQRGAVAADTKVDQVSPRPGLYIWGNNTNNIASDRTDITAVRSPLRHPWFDGKLLKDVAVSDVACVAVLENGDVAEWGNGNFFPKVVLKKKDIAKVKLASSGRKVFALGRSGSVYEWNTGTEQVAKVTLPSLGFREYVVDLVAGEDHVLALTSSGRVLSGATVEMDKSKGQFGIASFSQFDSPPPTGELHEVKLLRDMTIDKIAAGSYHSLVQSADGRLFVFGDNTFGQLGLPYTYRTANIATPTELPVRDLAPGGTYLTGPRVDAIYAGGNISYFVLNNGVTRQMFSMGDGSKGQLGTGSFSNSQRQPVNLRYFNDLSEYSEQERKVVAIQAEYLSIAPTHSLAVLGTSQRDVVVWGGNEYGQLGNGKRSTSPKPVPLVDIFTEIHGLQLLRGKQVFEDERGKRRSLNTEQRAVAGPNSTAIFTAPL